MKFNKSKETLDKVIEIIESKEKGAYLRFGDGDIVIANGGNSQDQKFSNQLASELKEALGINHKNVLKCIPLYCKKYGGFEEGMFPGNHLSNDEWADKMLEIAKRSWGGPLEDVYSHVALHFTASQNPKYAADFLKRLKSNCKSSIFVGNKNTSDELLKTLFGDDVQFVKTPTEESYNDINRIENEKAKLGITEYTSVITAMGDAGRALQKRIYKKYDNVFLFDFGSFLSVLADDVGGKNWRAWIDLSGVKSNSSEILNSLK